MPDRFSSKEDPVYTCTECDEEFSSESDLCMECRLCAECCTCDDDEDDKDGVQEDQP